MSYLKGTREGKGFPGISGRSCFETGAEGAENAGRIFLATLLRAGAGEGPEAAVDTVTSSR